MSDGNWAYLGTGGETPSVLFWNGEEIKVVVPGSPGQSVYRIAISPDCTRVLVGTSHHSAGNQHSPVRVFERDHEGGLGETPSRFWWQPSFVTGLAALTEDLFVSSGYDGRIHIWSFGNPQKAVASHLVSPLPVLALAPLSDTLFAITSADGRLRVWDAELGQITREVSLADAGPGTGRLLSLVAAPDHRIILSLSPGGHAAIHDLDGDLALAAAQPPAIRTSAVEVVGDWVVLADATSSRLVARKLPDLVEERIAPVERPVHALISVTDDSFISIEADTNATGVLWTIGDTLKAVSVLDAGQLRCGHGPPRRAQLEIGRYEREDKRKEMLGRALEFLRGGQHDQLRFELERLSLEGMGLEALLLLAGSFQQQGKPLWELRAWLALSLELESTPEHAIHFVTLAQLLENLGEPEKARAIYEKALTADPQLTNIVGKIQALSGKEGPSSLPHDVVRDDLCHREDAFLQEVEKMATLGVIWQWRTVMMMEESDTPFVPSLGDVDFLSIQLGNIDWEVEEVRVRSGRGNVRSTRWAVLRLASDIGENWLFAVEPILESGRVRLAYRLILEPDQGDTSEDTALAVLSQVKDFQEVRSRSNPFQRLRSEVEMMAKAATSLDVDEKDY